MRTVHLARATVYVSVRVQLPQLHTVAYTRSRLHTRVHKQAHTRAYSRFVCTIPLLPTLKFNQRWCDVCTVTSEDDRSFLSSRGGATSADFECDAINDGSAEEFVIAPW